jgi:CRP-like cAMP-binding protein
MASKFESALDEISIFRNLDEEQRAAIARTCQWRRVQANELVVGHLDATTDAFFVVQGHLRAMLSSLSGKAVTYHDVGPGELFGEFAAIDGATRSADVYALDEAFIGSMSSEAFQSMLQGNPTVAMALFRRLVHIIRELNERVFEFSALSVNNRIHAELLRHAYACGVEGNTARIDPSPTHAEIAAKVSTTREAVTREINALARSGILEKHKHALVINDIALLNEALTREVGDLELDGNR